MVRITFVLRAGPITACRMQQTKKILCNMSAAVVVMFMAVPSITNERDDTNIIQVRDLHNGTVRDAGARVLKHLAMGGKDHESAPGVGPITARCMIKRA